MSAPKALPSEPGREGKGDFSTATIQSVEVCAPVLSNPAISLTRPAANHHSIQHQNRPGFNRLFRPHEPARIGRSSPDFLRLSYFRFWLHGWRTSEELF